MKPAPPVSGASMPIESVLEQLIALARCVFALAGAAETVAASAVAAATAANSGNDLVFLMYELLLAWSGVTKPRADKTQRAGDCWRSGRPAASGGGESLDPAARVGELVEAHHLA